MQQQSLVPWGSFVPYHIASELGANPATELVGAERRLPAIALFADISGFTTLSEALAGGPAGAEELTGILNAYFTPIIALIQSYGGIIGKFGGDSLTAFFPIEAGLDHPTPRRAVACALALQASSSRYAALETSSGSFTLAMRVGLADGSVYCTVVGDPASRLEPIIAGSVLERAAAAEAAAAPAEVVVPASMLASLGWARTAPRGERDGMAFHAVLRSADIPSPNPLAPLPPFSAAAVGRIAAFLPPTIAQRLHAGRLAFIGEHRAVTSLFVGFSGFDYDDPAVGAALHPYLAQLFAIVQRYDGYVNKVDMGDKGSTLLILFGAPVSHEDDTARALQCALDLRELHDGGRWAVDGAAALNPDGQSAPGALQIGIASGFVFSGQVGSTLRQEYTVIGDAVNLASRLMQAATPGEILAADDTARLGNGGFHWAEPRTLQLRGRSGAVIAHPLVAARAVSEPNTANSPAHLLGRSLELAFLQERLELALEGRGQVVSLGGSAGVGKSALAAALGEAAQLRGATWLSGECVSYRTASPYLVWRPILRGLLGLADSAPPEAQAKLVAARLEAIDARLLPLLPLLSHMLGLAAPESELTIGMEAAARKAATEALVGELLTAAASERPLLILLENCQWIDALSRDLLLALARRCASLPLLLLLAYRGAPEAREEWAAPLRAAQLPHFGELRLGDLEPADAAALVELVYRRRNSRGTPSEALVEQVLARTQGNPLFIVELLGMLHERGPDAERAAAEGMELPDTLHRLVLSRIDRLGESARTVLKVASVVGQEFSANWLVGVYPALGLSEALDRPLDELRRSELAILGNGGVEPAYSFRHVITREVAYESLSTVLRTDLHARVGDYIEARYAADLDPFLDLLAHHYSMSDNRAKQREYLLRAGIAAQAAFANEAAVSFYERLLPLLAEREQSDVLLRLGQVLRHIGRWDAAEQQFRAALRLAHDQLGAARCRLEQGDLLRRRGDPSAQEWLEAARRSFVAANNAPGISEAERQLGLMALAQGDYPRALSAFEQAIKPGSDAADPNRTSLLLVNLGAVFYTTGDLARALDCFERSLRLAAQAGNRQRVGVAVGNLGGIYHVRGDYSKALDCYTQKLHCALEIGDRLEMCISIGNLGHIYEDQGEFARATSCYLRSLELALELGDRMGVGMALLGLGTVAIAEGELVHSEALVGQAEVVFAAMEATYELADGRVLRAELAARSGANGLARTLLLEAGELAEAAGNDEAAGRCALLALQLDHERGALSDDMAVALLRERLEPLTNDERRAELLLALVRIDGTQAAARAAAAGLYRALHMATAKLAYRRAYLELMGVALPLPPPLPAPPAPVTRRLPGRETLIERADSFVHALQAEPLVERATGAG